MLVVALAGTGGIKAERESAFVQVKLHESGLFFVVCFGLCPGTAICRFRLARWCNGIVDLVEYAYGQVNVQA